MKFAVGLGSCVRAGRICWVSADLVPDDLWDRVAPLLPARPARRYPERLPADDRAALRGIVYVLCASVSWRDVPADQVGCSGVTVTCLPLPHKEVSTTSSCGPALPRGRGSRPTRSVFKDHRVVDHGGVIRRHELTDQEWELLAPLIPRAATGHPRVEDRRSSTGWSTRPNRDFLARPAGTLWLMADGLFFPASKPREVSATVGSAFTDCASMTAALGSWSRSSARRTASRSRSCSSAASRQRAKKAYTRGQGGKSDGIVRIGCRCRRGSGSRRSSAGGSSPPAVRPGRPAIATPAAGPA